MLKKADDTTRCAHAAAERPVGIGRCIDVLREVADTLFGDEGARVRAKRDG